MNAEHRVHTGAVRMDRGLATTLGIAVIAHAIAFALVREHSQNVAATVVPESRDVIELTELTHEEPVAEPQKIASAPALTTKTTQAIKISSQGKELVAIAIPTAAAAVGADVPAAPGASSGSEPAKTASKIPPLINLDSPGTHAWILPSAKSDNDPAKKLDTQLKGALDAADTANGTGFGGPVVSAAHNAWYSSTTLGWATFDVTTDSIGAVTSVRVVEYSSGPGGSAKQSWDGVAGDIRRNLEKKKLRVPTGASGVAVRVRVEADMKYPSGATTPVKPLPCIGICGEFDLSDIGQSKKRVVQVRIVSESRLN